MYEDFALVYDELMEDVPYEAWADMLHELISMYGISRPKISTEDKLEAERNQVLELACGTGTLTELMYKKGYDMIGTDISQDMLNIALEKKDMSGSDILYLNQDMRELDLYSTVGTVYCFCDSINYLLTIEDLGKVFSLVRSFLYPGGIFVFDFNTVYKYENVIGDTTIAEDRDDVSFIWDNIYDAETHINEYDLSVFVETADNSGLYRKFRETHFQRGYELSEIRKQLSDAGFDIIKVFDRDNGAEREVSDSSERIFIVAG